MIGTLWTNKTKAIMICVGYHDGWATLVQVTPLDPTSSKISIHSSNISRYYTPYLPSTPLPHPTPHTPWRRK